MAVHSYSHRSLWAAVPAMLDTLNPAQRQAAEHPATDRALLVIAGAGTGKTATLAARVVHLLQQGIDPQRLLLMTFSRRAAGEMEHRVGLGLRQALGLRAEAPAPRLPWCGTFHAIGARLLRELAPRLGLAEAYTVLDRGDAQELMGWVRQSLGLAASHARFPLPATCCAIHSRVVNASTTVAAVVQEHYPWCLGHEDDIERLFDAYLQEKHRQQSLDLDDLLLLWWHAMREPDIARSVSARFDAVLVDEYQDTNRLQDEILRALRPDGHGLTVVGDDAQAIYAFRAAEVRNILDFPQRFEPPARVVALERNYRSTQAVLEAANAVIALSAERHAKTLWSARTDGPRPQLVSVEDEAAQARWVADRVLQQREEGLPLKRQAVLFRTAQHSAGLELELTRRRIPFVKYGGLRFLEATHVKDVTCVLRWAENPLGRLAAFRVARLVPGIGPAHARRLADEMAAAPDPRAALTAFKPPAAARAAWPALVQLMQRLSDPASAWPGELSAVVDWYLPHLHRLHDDATVRRADLDQLGRLAAAHGSRTRFLTELTLDPPEATSDEAGPPLRDEDYLILSTIHSAKGQEWNAVHVLNVVDGCMPADLATGRAAEIEEERRLLYVAMTRAKDHLHLLVPQRFYLTQQRARGDLHVYASISRFIPPPVQALFDAAGPASVEAAKASLGTGPVVPGVMAAWRDRWRGERM